MVAALLDTSPLSARHDMLDDFWSGSADVDFVVAEPIGSAPASVVDMDRCVYFLSEVSSLLVLDRLDVLDVLSVLVFVSSPDVSELVSSSSSVGISVGAHFCGPCVDDGP